MNRCFIKRLYLLAIAGFIFFGVVDQKAFAQFNLNIDFDPGLDADIQLGIGDAEVLWETNIRGYRPDAGPPADGQIDISITVAPIADPGVIGQAQIDTAYSTGPFTLPDSGSITLDSDEIATFTREQIADLVAHEIGHVLGVGSLWVDNGVYTNGSGEYTGQIGTFQFITEFDANATNVPVELDGGEGTADAHWDEGTGLVGYAGAGAGMPLDEELLTGTLNATNFLSDTSLGALEDIGFTTILSNGDFNWTGTSSTTPLSFLNWEGFTPTAPFDGRVLGFQVNPQFDPIFGNFLYGDILDPTSDALGGITVGHGVSGTITLVDDFTLEDGADILNLGVASLNLEGGLALDGKLNILTLDRNANIFFNGIITSADADPTMPTIQAIGDGTIHFLSPNTIPNGIRVFGGTIIVGDEDGLGAGPIISDGESNLNVDHSLPAFANDIQVNADSTLGLIIGDSSLAPIPFADRTATISGDLMIDGILQANSSGFFNFTGDSTGSTGEIQFLNGTNRIGGDLSDIDVTVGAQARLEGNGTVDDLILNGLINPGNGGTDIDTFNINGNATLFGEFELDFLQLGAPTTGVAGTDNDTLDVTGTATLSSSGEVIPILSNQGLPAEGDKYPIITAGTITDTDPKSGIQFAVRDHPLLDWTLDLTEGTMGGPDTLFLEVQEIKGFNSITTEFAPGLIFFDDLLASGNPASDPFFDLIFVPTATNESVQNIALSTETSMFTSSGGLQGASRNSTLRTISRIQTRDQRLPQVSSDANQSSFYEKMKQPFGSRNLIRNAASYSSGSLDAPRQSNGNDEGYAHKTLAQPTIEGFDWNNTGRKAQIFVEFNSVYFEEERFQGRRIKSFDYGTLIGAEISDMDLGDWAKWKVGVAFGIGSMNVSNSSTSTEINDTYTKFIGYAGMTSGRWRGSMLVGSAAHWANSRRVDALSNATGDYVSIETFFSLAVDYTFPINKDWDVVPYLNTTLHKVARDSFAERGTNALVFNHTSSEAHVTGYGVSFNWKQDFMSARFAFGGEFESLRDSGDVTFGGIGANGRLLGIDAPRSSFHFGSELDMQITEWLELFARYDLNAAERATSHAAHFGARFLLP